MKRLPPLAPLALLLALLLVGCGDAGSSPASPDDAGVADGGADVVTTADTPGGEDAPDTADAPGAEDAVADLAEPTDARDGGGEDAAGDAEGDAEGDADDGGDTAAPLPDPSFVHEARTSAVVIADEPVAEEVAAFYRTAEQLPDPDVRALLWAADTLWVGTPSGLYRWDVETDRFVAVPLPLATSPAVVDLATGPADELVVAHADGLSRPLAAGGGGFVPLAGRVVTAVAVGAERIWVGTTDGAGSLAPDTLTWESADAGYEVRDLAWVEGAARPWAATAAGLRLVGSEPAEVRDAAGGFLADDDVRAVVALPGGELLAGTATGLAQVGAESATLTLAGELPLADIRAVAARGDLVALGHGIGATVRRVDGSHSDHYHSLRWILDETVQAVALGPDGARWLGTAAGLTRVDLVPRTLADKAAFMEAFLDAHHWRMDGFVAAEALFPDPWTLEGPTHRDKDNDGLWTQMQVGAWALAGGATSDPYYCEQARRAIRTMFLQIDIPAADFEAAGLGYGFVTRSLVRDDEGTLFEEKATRPNWHLTEWEGHEYYWKDDTSSDETTGHFFGYPLYYDLCAADDAERAAVADRAGALAGYILDHGFRLVDVDGEQTTHGEWQPEELAIALDGVMECAREHDPEACFSAFGGHGWLNALEILGHMLAAWHMTGDPRFYEAYEHLVVDERYGELVDFTPNIMTVTQPPIANHSDHELAILAYFTLIRYEPDDARRERWIRSLLSVYEYERPERNPLWAFLVASAVEEGADVALAARTLHEIPQDLRKVRYDNAHRRDARVIGEDRHGDPQFDRVLPYDELRTFWWNGNPYAVAGGGNPRETQSPMFYLLPYWGLRYFGAIGE